MFNCGGEIPNQQNHPQEPQPYRCYWPHVQIIEQPGPVHRFRYAAERRHGGSMPGASSTLNNRTFPAIQIVGYQGKAIVVVSCVTTDPPYRPHPNKLTGRKDCCDGICISKISPETMCATFPNMVIECMMKKDMESSLRLREKHQIDPFQIGFSRLNEWSKPNIYTVRLCFQVFIEIDAQCKVPLEPVISNPINDKRFLYFDLMIIKLSDSVSYVDGGNKDIILLCNKVRADDIQVRLWEEKNGQILWEGFADFQTTDVYKNIAISFRTPRYRTMNITKPVSCFIQLQRPSDGTAGIPLTFQLLPLDSDTTPSTSANIGKNLGGTSTMSIGSSLLNVNNHELKELAIDIMDKDPLINFSNLSLANIGEDLGDVSTMSIGSSLLNVNSQELKELAFDDIMDMENEF